MDDLLKAISPLVAAAPEIAKSLIFWYYLYWTTCAAMISGTILGAVGMVGWLIYRWQTYEFNRRAQTTTVWQG